MKLNLQKLYITFFYSGLIPKAPGTAGSIAGVLVSLLILKVFHLSTETLFLLTILFTLIAYKTINEYEERTKTHDDKSIVIDEVVGVWIAIAFSYHYNSYIEILLALIYFRIFDIWKPSIIGKIDREAKGAVGVLGDDLIAGVISAICVVATYKFLLLYIIN